MKMVLEGATIWNSEGFYQLSTFYFQLWHTFKMFSVSCYKSLIINNHEVCDQEIHLADLIGPDSSSI
jgi:hypothetical protein